MRPKYPATPKPNCEQPELLTQEEVAARLKVTVRTVIRLQHDGVLPVIELGKAVRFYWPTVISHLNANYTVCRVAAPLANAAVAARHALPTRGGLQ